MSKQKQFSQAHLDEIVRNAERRSSVDRIIRKARRLTNPNQNAPVKTFLDAHTRIATTRSLFDNPTPIDKLPPPDVSPEEKRRSRIALLIFSALVLGGVYLLVSEPGVASTDPEYAKKKKTRNIGGWVVLILGFSVLFATYHQ